MNTAILLNGLIRCRKCGIDKPREAFNQSKLRHRTYMCRPCDNRSGTPYRQGKKRVAGSMVGRRSRCIKLGIPFDINTRFVIDLWRKQEGRCALSGLLMLDLLSIEKKGGQVHARSPSLDRIIPALGYVEGNVRWICNAINALRGTMTDDEMFILVDALYGFRHE